MVAGFPNLFIITGPGQPVGAVEHDGVDRAARRLDRRLPRAICASDGIDRIEATREAEDELGRACQRGAPTPRSIPQANSWYMGANVPGKPRIFMPYIGGVNVYRRICDAVAAKGYEGFALTRRSRYGRPSSDIKVLPFVPWPVSACATTTARMRTCPDFACGPTGDIADRWIGYGQGVGGLTAAVLLSPESARCRA